MSSRMNAITQTATVADQARRESGTGGVFSPPRMSPALTPELALRYLRELSADIREAIVLDGRGSRLAGDPALTPAATELQAEMGDAGEAEGATIEGVVVAARAGDHTIVLVCGSQALVPLARHDLRLVLVDLGAPALPAQDPKTVPAALVHRLLAAAPGEPGG